MVELPNMPEFNAIQELKIHGFRGFSNEQSITFAQLNGEPGSGLTILVGPNNSGKYSIAESVMTVTQQASRVPVFSEGKRNVSAGSRVVMQIKRLINLVRFSRVLKVNRSYPSLESIFCTYLVSIEFD